ncbi:alpha/beta fold hydrolase [Microlunatus speluncae]|uniref:alpha/beta fold hydrolase n=1 Tax=Microlunatus speluncae TaxID=2594267 RepID=UPI00126632A0|nr:alpha/beta fold hydrolase [Microlunatus speluncae]
MWYGILGPLEVARDGHSISVGGPQQQVLLGVLLLNANTPVPADRLIDHLWGDGAPSSARRLLHGCVASLRRTLVGGTGEPSPLARQGPGYVLRVRAEELDRSRFAELVDAARESSGDRSRAGWEHRSSLLREALAYWRGPVLDGVALDGCLPETIALEERRLRVLEQRVEADLILGRHAEVVPELQVLARLHPLREHPRKLLMAALARCGRQGDALASFRDLRTALMDELGVEPSTSVQELHQQILSGEAVLDGGALESDHAVIELAAPHHELGPRPVGARHPSPALGEQVVRYAMIEGRTVAWSAVGNGPPLIFAGWCFSQLELDWRNTAFQRFVREFAEQHTVIRYDRLGSGLSDPGSPARSLAEEVEVLGAVVDAVTAVLGDPGAPVGLFGYSSGGCVASAYAATRPDRVDRLVLFGAYAFGGRIASPRTRDALLRVVGSHRGLGSHILASILLPGQSVAERDEFARCQRASSNPERAVQALAAAFAFDGRPQLAQIRAASLVVHRRADRAVPVVLGQELASRIPGAAFVPLDGVDHLPWSGDQRTPAELAIDFLDPESAAAITPRGRHVA